MAKAWQEKFYHSHEWKLCRRYVLELHHGLCASCEAKGIIRTADVVHHKIFLNANNVNDAEISLNPEHLIPLCATCHAQAHGTQTERRYIVRQDGTVEII